MKNVYKFKCACLPTEGKDLDEIPELIWDRLQIYDQLRIMHRLLKDIPDQEEDSFEQSALDTVAGVLYLAEGVFATEPEDKPIL